MVRDWQGRADELASEAYGAGEPTAWFERLYAEGAAGTTTMAWDRSAPHPVLAAWADGCGLNGNGRRAVVVGSGLGADAEFIASRGFGTTGFDLSGTAIDEARRRHPESTVSYRVADLLALPRGWHQAFDLVIEVYTLQALPDPPRLAAAAAVRSLVAPGGQLLAVQFRDDGSHLPDEGPPFALSETFLTDLARDGLELATLEALEGPLWRAEYRRSA